VAGAGSSFQVVQLLTPHSLYMLLLAELGIFGILAFVGLVIALLGACGRAIRAGPRDPRMMSFAMFCFGVMVVYAITSIYGDLGGPSTLLEQVLVGCAVWTAAHSPGRRSLVDDDEYGDDDDRFYDDEYELDSTMS
jgi:hypothetical protein